MLARFTTHVLPKAKGAYDCASCNGADSPADASFICYKKKTHHNIKGAGAIPDLGIIAKADLLKQIGAVFNGDAMKGCYVYGICPIPFFEKSTLDMIETYHLCNGTSNIQSPIQLGELPAFYVQVCQVIDKERTRTDGNIQ